jgi:hypothetical protein
MPARTARPGLDAARLLITPVLLASLAFTPGGCGSKSPAAPSSTSVQTGACVPTAGSICLGQNSYAEYDAGDLPIVVSVPHGGSIAPSTIPDRVGTTVTDTNTIALGRAIVQAFVERTGRAPHLVICLLKRTKLDANRELADAAQGNADAAQAWGEYHGFVDLATSEVVKRYGRGFYIDLHGHGHDKQRLELGYLLTSSTLDLTDAQLDAGGYASSSSLHVLMFFTHASFPEALRGATSLGGLVAPVASVPSPGSSSPNGDPYFDGGYSTERHTATLPGVQIESNYTGIRDTAASRASFGTSLAAALATFLSVHLGLSL